MLELEEIKPFGLIVYNRAEQISLSEIDISNIVDWLANYHLLLFRGFSPFDSSEFINYARKLGPLLEWEFGELLNLRMEEKPLNHLFNSGRVEMHWDGAYLTEQPKYSIFQCLNADDTFPGGETIFTNTVKLLKSMSDDDLSEWRSMSISYKTDKAAHYGGNVEIPLICKHPHLQKEVVRFIEPFNEDNIEVNPVEVGIQGIPLERQKEKLLTVINKIYSDDVMYQHHWKKGDFLIYDNNALLHGRNKLQHNVNRHLQRIHILNGEPYDPNRKPNFIGLRSEDVHQ